VASKGRHTRSTPQLPLATPEADPEKIIRKGKAPREGTSTAVLGDSGNFHNPSLKTPVAASHSPIIPSVGVSRNLNFGSFPVDFSPPSLGLEGEIFDTLFPLKLYHGLNPGPQNIFPLRALPLLPLLEFLHLQKGKPLFPQAL
jgi:hypothetical protein